MKLRTIPISDFCITGSGGTPSRQKGALYYGGQIPWVKSGELRESIINESEEKITEFALSETNVKIVPEGAILLAMYGATVGRLAWLGIQAATNQAVCHIIPDEQIADKRYFFYALQSKIPDLLSRRVGGAQPNISQTIIKETLIPLPTIEEQKRIAAILDKADAIRRKRQQAIQLADEFLRSVFLDMFGNVVKNTKNWPVVRFGDVCSSRLGKMLDQKQQTGKHLRKYLRNANVLWNHFYLDELFEMDFNEKNRKEFRLKDGDVLICEGGDAGRSAIWRNELSECYFQKALHRVQPDKTKILPEYIVHLLWFYSRNGGFQDHITSVTIAHLTGVKLKDMNIPLPPLQIQNKFINIIKKLDKNTEILKNLNNDSKTLFNSLTQRAFRGEL